MKFPHLQGREKLLEPLGFTPQESEWIALVCLHSGLFIRAQVEAFLGSTQPTASRFVQRVLDARFSGKPIARDLYKDGRRICQIFGKRLYRALEIPNIRHRREASIEVTRRRLLSLDFVLDQPELAWLPTEQEKVACFERLGIDPELLPKRIYAGRANGRIRYFHIKMPVAVEQDRAIFTYIDPGMSTRSELDSWGKAHRRLWDKLRQTRRTVEVFAAAWDRQHLDRTERVLQAWTTRAPGAARTKAEALRQAIADADWATVERHGGLDAVVDQIDRADEETAPSAGAGWIDSFRLRGSSTCRHMNAY